MKNRIVIAREFAGLNQKELAQKLGISPSTLNGYEKGNHDPKSTGLIGIAKACNVTTDFLLGISDRMEKTQDGFSSDKHASVKEKKQSYNSDTRLLEIIHCYNDMTEDGKDFFAAQAEICHKYFAKSKSNKRTT